MEIQTVAIVGLGALGTLFGHQLSGHMPRERLRIVADQARIDRYRRDGLTSNGEPCDFAYVTPEAETDPADLVLVAVKALQLEDALRAIRRQVGPDTLILSLLNGITSEGVVASVYGADKVVDCVAYGMDAVKEGNRLTYRNMGKLCIGPRAGETVSEPIHRIARFFERTQFPYEIDPAMPKRMWGKFMLNVGVNQTVAVFGPNYAAIQKPGAQREIMIAAMREVMALSVPADVNLTEEDLAYWLNVLTVLNPEGKPSMRQDVDARRPSEVALFSGAVLDLSRKAGIASPVNQMLFDRIAAMEAQYAR